MYIKIIKFNLPQIIDFMPEIQLNKKKLLRKIPPLFLKKSLKRKRVRK